jgi:hypothetical protein
MTVKASSGVQQRLLAWASRNEVALESLNAKQLAQASKELGVPVDKVVKLVNTLSSTGMEGAVSGNKDRLAPELPKPAPIAQREVFGASTAKVSLGLAVAAFDDLAKSFKPSQPGVRFPATEKTLFERYGHAAQRLVDVLQARAGHALGADLTLASGAITSRWAHHDPKRPTDVDEAVSATQHEMQKLTQAATHARGDSVEVPQLLRDLVKIAGQGNGLMFGLAHAVTRVADTLPAPQRTALREAADAARLRDLSGAISSDEIKQREQRLLQVIEEVANTLC